MKALPLDGCHLDETDTTAQTGRDEHLDTRMFTNTKERTRREDERQTSCAVTRGTDVTQKRRGGNGIEGELID